MPDNLKSVLLRVSQGDGVAFKELFENFSGKVYAFALKLTNSESTAEELVQEVFLKVWINRRTLEDIHYFPSWLHTVCRNLAFNMLKRIAVEHRAKTEIIRDLREESSETEDSIVYRDYEHILQKAIDRLSPQQRIVYSLCHGEGLKYEEAAKKLHISKLTVKTHMQQALRNIKSHLRTIAANYWPLIFFIGSDPFS